MNGGETVKWLRDGKNIFFRRKSSEKYDKEQKEECKCGELLTEEMERKR